MHFARLAHLLVHVHLIAAMPPSELQPPYSSPGGSSLSLELSSVLVGGASDAISSMALCKVAHAPTNASSVLQWGASILMRLSKRAGDACVLNITLTPRQTG